MTVRVSGKMIHVEGNSLVEDAEPILAALQADVESIVDISTASRLHSATIQMLLALKPVVRGAPSDSFQAREIAPLFTFER